MLEFQMFTMDQELAQLILHYFMGGFKPKGNALRTVPVNQVIPDNRLVATYDGVREIIKSNDRILIAPCACVEHVERRGMKVDQTREVCFMFGFNADFYADKGLGR